MSPIRSTNIHPLPLLHATNLLNNPLAQSKNVMCISASVSMFTTPNVPLVHLLMFEKLTLMARAESASAAPASLDCEQADHKRCLGGCVSCSRGQSSVETGKGEKTSTEIVQVF